MCPYLGSAWAESAPGEPHRPRREERFLRGELEGEQVLREHPPSSRPGSAQRLPPPGSPADHLPASCPSGNCESY